jgi:L-histidine N-alpha-methyltransferase
MSTPLSIASTPPDVEQSAFAEDVAYYLSLTPRQLPSRYLYDDIGSALFEVICRLPWYHITRTERQLLNAHGADILRRVGHPTRIVELGPGCGEKLVALLSGYPPLGVTAHLIDVSSAALSSARRALAVYPDLVIEEHETTYENGLAEFARLPPVGTGTALVLFLGSNIGNFDPPDAGRFLRDIRAALAPGDSLLLGVDLVKPEPELLMAYADPLGVTASFNRNLLVRANRQLGANFDLASFTHRAVWNESASRVEMHLVSTKQQRVQVPAAHIDVMFDPGEIIWTESSYKYDSPRIAAMLDHAGFGNVEQRIANGFSLTLAEAR